MEKTLVEVLASLKTREEQLAYMGRSCAELDVKYSQHQLEIKRREEEQIKRVERGLAKRKTPEEKKAYFESYLKRLRGKGPYLYYTPIIYGNTPMFHEYLINKARKFGMQRYAAEIEDAMQKRKRNLRELTKMGRPLRESLDVRLCSLLKPE